MSFDLPLGLILLKMQRQIGRCHMDSLTSTGESIDGETSWEYVEGEEEEEGEEWEYEEVEEEPEVPKREVLICENLYSSSLSIDI